jgi:hypothetical protein
MNDTIRTYVDELVGAPYVWWREGMSTLGDHQPFWAQDAPPPPAAHVRANGCNCAGFINLLCRLTGRALPGVAEGNPYAAGTYVWAEHLWPVLEPFDPSAEVAAGTLLLRRYRSPEDQGHVAVIWSSGPVIEQRLAHSYIADGVAINDTVAETHYGWADTGYYEYMCRPNHWLNI